jgi:hypothetical protein
MTTVTPVLDPAAQEFADANAKPPFLFDLSPEEGRKIVDSVQDGDIPAPPADVTDLTLAGGPSEKVSNGQMGTAIQDERTHGIDPAGPGFHEYAPDWPE